MGIIAQEGNTTLHLEDAARPPTECRTATARLRYLSVLKGDAGLHLHMQQLASVRNILLSSLARWTHRGTVPLMKRTLLIALAATALTSCATRDAVTYDGSAIARVGHPVGYRYSPATHVKSGSCRVEITSPRLVAFGCLSEDGIFVEYKPVNDADDHCALFERWATALGGTVECSTGKTGAKGSAKFAIDGTRIDATLTDSVLRVTRHA